MPFLRQTSDQKLADNAANDDDDDTIYDVFSSFYSCFFFIIINKHIRYVICEPLLFFHLSFIYIKNSLNLLKYLKLNINIYSIDFYFPSPFFVCVSHSEKMKKVTIYFFLLKITKIFFFFFYSKLETELNNTPQYTTNLFVF